MMSFFLLWMTLMGFIDPSFSQSYDQPRISNNNSIGIGGYVPFGFNTQRTDSGKNNSLAFDPMLVFYKKWPLFKRHFLFGEIGYVLHIREEDSYTKNTYFLACDLAWFMKPSLFLRYGVGLFFTSISGGGESIQTRNGAGTTDYAAPSRLVVSQNMTFNLAFEFEVGPRHSLKLASYTFGLLDSKKRKVSYALSVFYHF